MKEVRIVPTGDEFDDTDWQVYSQPYRKKPVVIAALRLEVPVEIETREGTMIGGVGDYLIRGVNGEFYPCKPEIFEQTYEKVR